MFDIGSIGVAAFVSGVLTITIMIVATKKLILPLLTKGIEESYGYKFDQAEKAISRGMKAMGEKSGLVRGTKTLEKEMFSEILEQYPEIQALLETFSPELAVKIEENPEMAAAIIQRYLPLLQQAFPQIFKGKGKLAQKQSDYDFG